MNEFCNLVTNIKNNDTILLEKNKIYDVRQDDSFTLKGFYCSNTAKKHENPDGTRTYYIIFKTILNIIFIINQTSAVIGIVGLGLKKAYSIYICLE